MNPKTIMDSYEDENNSGMMPRTIVVNNEADGSYSWNDNKLHAIPNSRVMNNNNNDDDDDNRDENENDFDLIQTTTNKYEDDNENKDKTNSETLPVVARTMVTTITTKVVPANWFTIVKTSVVCSIIVICIFITIVLTVMGVWVYSHINKKRIHLVSFTYFLLSSKSVLSFFL
jgi:hypothetical protein